MSVRLACASLFVGLLALTPVAGPVTGIDRAEAAEAVTQPKAVIELFTSQGCSSCPPADKLMAEYADRDDVLSLSFNVDVWDWIGWKDTLADPAYTERQRGYAAAMGERSIYTPQVIVDGKTHVVGSDRYRIEKAIATGEELPVPIEVTASEDSITVDIAPAQHNLPYGTLWLVLYDREVTVDVSRGENTGRTLTYTNVVRKLRPVAMWKGDQMSVDLPKSEIEHANVDGCALLLQVETEGGRPGPMLGAAKIAADW